MARHILIHDIRSLYKICFDEDHPDNELQLALVSE